VNWNGLILASAIGAIGFLDRLFVYYPSGWTDQNWAEITGLPLQEARFSAADGTPLFGWYIPAEKSPGVLLWCHGNAGNITHRLENIAMLYQRGLSVFIFDYRGYGRSSGKPSEEGLYSDALGAHDYLTQKLRIPSERIVAFGRSLGGPVAGELARRKPVAGLILESAFPSTRAVAKAHYFGLPMHVLVRARFDLGTRLPQLKIPILVIHGDSDTIIPFQLGREVYDAAPPPKDFYTIRGANHNDTYLVGGEPYFHRVKEFVKEVTSRKTHPH